MTKKEFRKWSKNNSSDDALIKEQNKNVRRLENLGMDVKNHNGFETGQVLLFYKNGIVIRLSYPKILKIVRTMDDVLGNTKSNSSKLYLFLIKHNLINLPVKTQKDKKTINLGIKCINAIGAYTAFYQLIVSHKDNLFLLSKEHQALNSFENFTNYNPTDAFMRLFKFKMLD